MDAKQNLYGFQMKRLEVFKAQNPESDELDVVFEIDGKMLYANKYTLCSISAPLKAMLSDRWHKPEEPVVISDYSFDDFKEFVTFIYSGECKLSKDNIFAMVDIAEYYDVDILKNACEEFLMTMIDLDNVYPILELTYKYPMVNLKEHLDFVISIYLSAFLECAQFLSLQKSVMKDIVHSNQKFTKQEELFEAIYKWAEHQTIDQGINKNDAMKEVLSDVLPYIKFAKMNGLFFNNFVAKRSFLFSGDEWSNLLWARSKICIKVTDEFGNVLEGELQCPDKENVVDVIQSQKNCYGLSGYSSFKGVFLNYWRTTQSKPSSPPNKLAENENAKWYLIYDKVGHIVLLPKTKLRNDEYLLAEMCLAHKEFIVSNRTKIEVIC